MRRNRNGIRDEIRGDRDGRRPRAHACAGNTDDEREPDGEDNQEHNGERDIQGIPANQERNTVGRESMDERILRKYSWSVRK